MNNEPVFVHNVGADVGMFVVWHNDVIVSSCTMTGLDTPYAYVSNVLTAEAHRRKGYASLLLHGVLDYLQKRGAKTCTLYVEQGNEAAMKLYTRFGFRIVSANADDETYYMCCEVPEDKFAATAGLVAAIKRLNRFDRRNHHGENGVGDVTTP